LYSRWESSYTPRIQSVRHAASGVQTCEKLWQGLAAHCGRLESEDFDRTFYSTSSANDPKGLDVDAISWFIQICHGCRLVDALPPVAQLHA
jgi:hypothetical protein